MDLPLLARLVLAAVFCVAGTGKLWDLADSQRAVADFGAPSWFARPIGILLPFVELAIAALLIPADTAFAASCAALVLLSAFLLAIAVNLFKGRSPQCRCFGHVQARPISRSTLARNGLLTFIAAMLVWTDRGLAAPSVATVMPALSHRSIGLPLSVTAAALAAQCWFVVHLFRQQSRLLLRIDAIERALEGRPAEPSVAGLPIGSPAPRFVLRSVNGSQVSFETLWGGGKTATAILIFTDPDCGPCANLLPEISRWQQKLSARTRIAVISSGPEEAVRRRTDRYGINDVLMQEASEVTDAYRAHWTPAAVLVRADGTIGSELVVGSDAIAELLTGSAGVPVKRSHAEPVMVADA